MSRTETDILQIRKYLNGELDAKAMHQLERRAQDDPFLMEALEGYESTGGDQQPHLDNLAGRLKERISHKKGRIIPLRLIGIAASVLIICSAGVWWMYTSHKENQPGIVAVTVEPVKPSVKQAPAVTDTTTELNKITGNDKASSPAKRRSRPLSNTVAFTPPAVRDLSAPNPVIKPSITDSASADTTPVNEMIVMGYVSNPKDDTTAKTAGINADYLKKDKDTIPERLLQGKAVGVAANNRSASNNTNNTLIVNGALVQAKTLNSPLNELSMTDKKAYSQKIIAGRVVGGDDGLPLVGASVKIKGTDIAATTDVNGRFKLPVGNGKKSLVVAYIGYQTREVNTQSRDSLKDIPLKPNNNSLSEVVVVGYGTQKNTDETVFEDARPREGWSSFKKYITKNAISPDHVTGIVKLSFTVEPDGAITGIAVKKGLSPATNQKAIDLLNNGPAWAGNTNGQPEKVNLRIRFGR